MSLSRRKFISLIGGGVVAAVAIPTTAFLTTRTPHKALEPWGTAGSYSDARLKAMSYALLAPNPHNRQPWLAKLEGTDSLRIYRDFERDLPITDPFGRQLTIGMGCFIELMRMAAAEDGYKVESTLMPEGENGAIAHCKFIPNAAQPDPLFQQVMDRRSHKDMFIEKPVDNPTSQQLKQYADIYIGGKESEALKEIAHGAWLTEAATPDAWQESIDLLRIGKAEINASPDGIDAGGPMLETLSFLGMFTREAASDVNNPGSRDTIESTANAILSTPAFTLNVTDGNTRKDQLEAGRQWMRLNLKTTSLGMALRPVSQALQEYEAVKPFYDRVHELFAENGKTVQMLGLLGYGELPARTPRWPIETRIMNA